MNDGTSDQFKRKKVSVKVLCHFLIKPRLQKLFTSSKMATHMRRHAEGRENDGILCHPANSKPWKCLDEINPNFKAEARNVRLGLAISPQVREKISFHLLGF